MPGNFQWQVPFTFAMWLICNCNLPSKVDLAKMLVFSYYLAWFKIEFLVLLFKQNAAKLVRPEISSNNSPSSFLCFVTKRHARWHQKAAVPRLWNFASLLRGSIQVIWFVAQKCTTSCWQFQTQCFFIQWWWQLSLNLISLTLRNIIM